MPTDRIVALSSRGREFLAQRREGAEEETSRILKIVSYRAFFLLSASASLRERVPYCFAPRERVEQLFGDRLVDPVITG